jgi:hypothetical protein
VIHPHDRRDTVILGRSDGPLVDPRLDHYKVWLLTGVEGQRVIEEVLA